MLEKLPVGKPKAEDLMEGDVEIVVAMACSAKKVEASFFCLGKHISFSFTLLYIALE